MQTSPKNDNMNSNKADLDLDSDVQDFYNIDNDATALPIPDHTFEEALSIFNTALTELITLNTKLAHQVQENRQVLQEIGTEILSHSILLTNLDKQSNDAQEKLGQLARQLKEQPDSTASLVEPLKQIQQSQLLLIKSRRQHSTDTNAPASTIFTRQSVALLALQGVVMALATVFLIHFVPPRVTARTEQQWYSIFQRVDRLYKDKFGNRTPK